MRVKVRDTEIYFDVSGPGLAWNGSAFVERPTMFVIHGGPGVDHTSLKARYGPFAAHVQVFYFDHRGQGRSARGDVRRYTLEENVEDLEALRRHLGFSAIINFGTSYGGLVAMAHAARYPSSVSRLVLAATTSHSGNLGRAKQILASRGTPEQLGLFEDVLAGRFNSPDDMRNYFRVMGPLFSRRSDPGLSEQVLAHAILSPEAQNVAYGPSGFLRSIDLRPELKRIRAPTLILCGRHDWICPPEYSEEIHRHIQGSRLCIFENSSHSIAGDEPEKFFEVVVPFLAEEAYGN